MVITMRMGILFFILSLITAILTASEIAGLDEQMGKVLISLFLVFSLFSFLLSLLQRNRPKKNST